jgi:Organic radical activating enzymes
MFGKNPLRKVVKGDGTSLLVHTVFGTIQGEGPFAGQPAIFVRLAGCNLACYFCDTEFENGAQQLSLDDLMYLVETERKKVKTNLVVLTGGEPMRQPIAEFIRTCFLRDLHVQIETAGTVWPEGLDPLMGAAPWPNPVCTLVCSPKTGKVHPKVEMFCTHWKYIVADGECDDRDGLPMFSTQREGNPMTVYRASHGTIWLQPREDYYGDQLSGGTFPDPEATRANMKLAAEIAMKFGYRLTLQTHKILGLP